LKPNQTLAQIENIDDSAVVIYPIIIRDRIQVLAKFPGQPLRYYPGEMSADTAVSQRKDMIIYTERSSNQKSEAERESIEKMVFDFRIAIEQGNPSGRNKQGYIEYGEQFYNFLIQPLAADLENHPDTQNLVFVLDSTLYNLPLAALRNPITEEYLVESQYNISILPNLAIFNLSQTLDSENTLWAAISESLQIGEERTFDELDISSEKAQMESQSNTTILYNQAFTTPAFREQIQTQDFAIAHLATHGKFSSDPEETYLLTYGEKPGTGQLLKAREFDQILQNNPSLQLLILSACQTAEGDNRAVLGLAGLAVRAGTNSAIASLWKIENEPTVKLLEYFYDALQQPGITKAAALRMAQNQLRQERRYQKPEHWSAFVLVGNWF